MEKIRPLIVFGFWGIVSKAQVDAIYERVESLKDAGWCPVVLGAQEKSFVKAFYPGNDDGMEMQELKKMIEKWEKEKSE